MKNIEKHLEIPHRETITGYNTLQTKPFDYQKTENMNNKKQTAVEWLVQYLTDRGYIHAPSFGHLIIDKAIQQAKEMEKEQIVTAWMATDNELQRIAAEQYYNAIYGQEDDWTEQKFYDLLPDICLIEDTTNENTNNQRCMGYNACKKCFNNFRNSVIIKNK